MDYGYNNYLFSAEQQFYPNGALPPSPPNSNGMGADGMNQASSQVR